MIGHLLDGSFIPNIFMNIYVQLVIAIVIQFYIGRVFYIGAYSGLKNKVLGMDFLVALGSSSAYIYSVIIIFLNLGNEHVEGYFEVSALVITIVLTGKYIEARMQSKTADVIDELLKLSPQKALKIEGSKEVEIACEDIKLGDKLITYAGSSIPADGVIIEGSTYVDESTFTGESNLVLKEVGDFVIGSTLNENSTIKIEVSSVGDDSVLNQIVSSIEEATISDTKFQRIADKVANIFVPIIVLIALATLAVTYFISEDISMAITNALAVVLISCPCALGLATPTSIMVSNQIASSHGILYKGSKFFELANKIEVIAFDKTGTLTKGVPNVKTFRIKSEDFSMLYSLQKHSTHPISKQILKYMDTKVESLVEIKNFQVLPGYGIKGNANNKELIVANYNYIKEQGINCGLYSQELSKVLEEGSTLSILVYDKEVQGYYTVEDEIKEGVAQIIQDLKDLGMTPLMITGDNEKVARNLARKVGIEEVYAEALPIDKAEILKKYKNEGKIVAMIGDGINDSVALKVADVGISVKNASDIASAASDVVLMQNDLKLIVDGIIISKRTTRNIKQNFMWAFSYNVVAIPLAATGNISMILASIAMSFSSIVVVLNALRLRKDKIISKL